MATATRAERVPLWLSGVAPLAAIAALIAAFFAFDPIGRLRSVPPVEALAVERTMLSPGEITLRLRNDGPDPVTVAQVLVNDAYNAFEITDPTLDRLETATLTIAYPWEEGLPLNIGMVTSTGLVIEHEIEAASITPEPDAGTFLTYALLGLYIGVIPVGIGLLFFPALRAIPRRWLTFFLAFTVGLLAFLLVDTVEEGIELAGLTPAVLNGLALFALGALGAVAGLVALQGWLHARGARATGALAGGLVLAYLISAGIGLHNLGEGLAVGAAVAAGEVALGRFLILGFAIHNTTEGLAIVAPLGSAERRPALGHFIAFGLLAGAPTILGAWGGGFAFSPAWAALAFGVAAGAIAQVIYQVGKAMSGGRDLATGIGALGFMLGLVFMYVTGLYTA